LYPAPTPGRSSNNASPYAAEDAEDERATMRTPSPTPEEAKLLSIRGFTDWSEAKSWRWWVRKSMIQTYLILGFVIAVVALVAVYEKPLVKALQPVGHTLKSWTVGWLIPIAILIVLSFPPLFGQEIVHLFCGLIWGPWIGFGIVVAGTVIGELANFIIYKRLCLARGQRAEKNNIEYACFAHAVREGGWFMATAARWSFLPTHFTTAIFSVCGMTFWVFIISTALSLPQLLVNVYSGYVIELDGSAHPSSTADTLVWVLFGVTAVVTTVAAFYIGRKVDAAKKPVIYARRKQRQMQRKLLCM